MRPIGRRARIRLATSYSYGSYAYGDAKTISLLRFESPQLWPLLDEARRVGVRLVQARPLQEVPTYATAQLCLDVTADETGDLAVEPVLRVEGAAARPVAFIGSSGHGVVCADGGLRLARLDKPAPAALQRMTLSDAPLVIPADQAARFAAEYYPRLRHIAAVTSSDESFTPPAIVGPTLVLRADYQAEHELELTCEWAYRLGDNDFRAPLGTSRMPLRTEARPHSLSITRRSYATAQLCLNVTADETGDLTVEPVLRVDGAAARPAAFIGSSGHGVVCADGGLRLARLDKPATSALQRMALSDAPLVIPADEVPRFVAEYYPRLRHVAAVTSSDESFTPPEIVGPTLVLRADFQAEHELELTWEWAYRLGDNDFRAPIGTSEYAAWRDLEAETALASSIDAPLEPLGLRAADGTLIAGARLSGLETMRFATEIQPLLAEFPDVALEVFGDPVDYREAGGSLVIAVTTDAVAGETDWFDLGVTISIEGNQVPFVSVFTALASGQSHLLLADGAYFALDKPELVKLRQLIEEARALTDAEDGPPRISRFQVGLFDELAELGVVTRQADEWRRQVDGLRALQGLEPAAVPTGLRAQLRPYQAEGFSWLATLHSPRARWNPRRRHGPGQDRPVAGVDLPSPSTESGHGTIPGGCAGQCGGELGQRGRTVRARAVGRADLRHAAPRRRRPRRAGSRRRHRGHLLHAVSAGLRRPRRPNVVRADPGRSPIRQEPSR